MITRATRTVTIPDDPTWKDLYQLTLADWQAFPTLESGHFDNLKFDNGRFRVWVSRQSLADYNGDADAFMSDRLTIEENRGGVWVKCGRYSQVERGGR